jgi:DNA-binding response OmpR family regulator
MPVTKEFQGLRVLLVEDDAMICLLFEDMLQEFGCEIVGPACDLERATDLAQGEASIDIAVLDVNLGGQLVFPVAEILAKRGVPILFATGLGADGLPEAWRGHQMLQKPMGMEQLAVSLSDTLRVHRRL